MVILGIAGLHPLLNKLAKKLVETVASREVTMLDSLHKKWLADSSLVIEEIVIRDSPSLSESSMDYVVNPPSSESLIPPVYSLIKKNVKIESGSGKPPYSSTRDAVKGLSLKMKNGSEKVVTLEGE